MLTRLAEATKSGAINGVPVSVETGTCNQYWSRSKATLLVDGIEWVWHEDPHNFRDHHEFFRYNRETPMVGIKMQIEHLRGYALRNFCRAFLAGEPSDTLRISCEAMRVLMPLVN